MRTMIAVPCMDMVHTWFFASMLSLRKPDDTEVAVSSSSLVFEARHLLASKAIEGGFDRILWLDSDMKFGPDLMERLSADMDTGLEYVSAVYFTRKPPVKPCIYEIVHDTPNAQGEMVPTAGSVKTIPNGLFEVEGTGFGAVMMTVELVRRVGRLPFYPFDGYGEDLSFCRRARAAGATLHCDGRIRIDHVGQSLVNESFWKKEREENER